MTGTPVRGARIQAVKPGFTSGLLTVCCPSARDADKMPSLRFWICQCRCGAFTEVRCDRLAYNGTKSCGCKQITSTYWNVQRLEGRLRFLREKHAEKVAQGEVLRMAYEAWAAKNGKLISTASEANG